MVIMINGLVNPTNRLYWQITVKKQHFFAADLLAVIIFDEGALSGGFVSK